MLDVYYDPYQAIEECDMECASEFYPSGLQHHQRSIRVILKQIIIGTLQSEPFRLTILVDMIEERSHVMVKQKSLVITGT